MLDNPRNLADDQIKAIANQGGLVGILALPERVGKGEVGIEDMLKHMDYMINLVGIEHLALGMDFVKYDGPRTLKDRHHPLHKDPLIKGFEEIEDLPNLIDGLQKTRLQGRRDQSHSRRQLSAGAQDDLAGTVGDLAVAVEVSHRQFLKPLMPRHFAARREIFQTFTFVLDEDRK